MAKIPRRAPRTAARKIWTLPCDGRLTTRRVDELTRLEIGILSEACRHGGVVIVHGHSPAEHMKACHDLQRFGYLWPVARAAFVDELDLGGYVLPALPEHRRVDLSGLSVECFVRQESSYAALRECARRITAEIRA